MTIDTIHNYYEMLVQERIIETNEYQNGEMNQDFFEDVACVALNQLPAKYVRHSVDLIFYMTQQERNDMYVAVDKAIRNSIETINLRTQDPADKEKKSPS